MQHLMLSVDYTSLRNGVFVYVDINSTS